VRSSGSSLSLAARGLRWPPVGAGGGVRKGACVRRRPSHGRKEGVVMLMPRALPPSRDHMKLPCLSPGGNAAASPPPRPARHTPNIGDDGCEIAPRAVMVEPGRLPCSSSNGFTRGSFHTSRNASPARVRGGARVDVTYTHNERAGGRLRGGGVGEARVCGGGSMTVQRVATKGGGGRCS
jgi:hypothetical protein